MIRHRNSVLNPLQYIDYFFVSQRGKNWCWAACLQTIFNSFGVTILQEEIVLRTYGTDNLGNLLDWPSTLQLITCNLNHRRIDKNGRSYQVQATFGNGAPNPKYLINELSSGFPVLVSYGDPRGFDHAVIIIGAEYENSINGLVITELTVFDPLPDAGVLHYSGIDLAQLCFAHWYIRVHY